MKKSQFKVLFSVLIMALVMLSCENNLEMILPQGPQGEKGDKGDKGDPGKSAFEVWKEFYGKDPNTPIEDFFASLKGKDGRDGFTPVIGENGNWWIDGEDTGKPAKGKDGVNGQTPTLEIGPGPNYYWIINGQTTDISAKGQNGKDGRDGKDGYTPVIGENGNWWIDGKDTGNPSVIIPEIGPGPEYNWIIGGVDTGKPSRGQDGVNGESVYELWKEAVDRCDGSITDKVGKPWPCGRNSEQDFFEWLKGGNATTLYEYWKTKEGNENKSMDDFLFELFSCHCDSVTIIVLAPNDSCVELNPDGIPNGTYNATLKIGGKAGTSIVITGAGISITGSIPQNATEVSFTIPRLVVDQVLNVDCTESDSSEKIEKSVTIPALKYVQLADQNGITVNSATDVVVINFATTPVEVSVEDVVIYRSTAITLQGGSAGWTVSNQGRTFTKTYSRGANVQKPTVQAKGDNNACSTIQEAFTIPSLNPVEVGTLNLSIVDDCSLLLSFTGTPGMKVTAMDVNNHANAVQMKEEPSGTYGTSALPRLYNAYTVLVKAELVGRGTVEETIEINGTNLAPVTDPLTISNVSGVGDNTSIALVKRRLTNHTDGALSVVISRGNNTAAGAQRYPQSTTFPFTINIPANGSLDLDFHRDYTETFADGLYEIAFLTRTECGLQKRYTLDIDNQQSYRHAFNMPEGWGDENGNPSDEVTFEVSVFEGIPGSYVEFQLFNGVAYGGVSRQQLDANGNLTWNVTMRRDQLQAALANTNGFFYFFSDANYKNKYSIGTSKESVTFAFN